MGSDYAKVGGSASSEGHEELDMSNDCLGFDTETNVGPAVVSPKRNAYSPPLTTPKNRDVVHQGTEMLSSVEKMH